MIAYNNISKSYKAWCENGRIENTLKEEVLEKYHWINITKGFLESIGDKL